MFPQPEHRTKNLISRINRIEDQVRGIRKMVEEEKAYDEIIIQLNAVQSAAQKIRQNLSRSCPYECRGRSGT